MCRQILQHTELDLIVGKARQVGTVPYYSGTLRCYYGLNNWWFSMILHEISMVFYASLGSSYNLQTTVARISDCLLYPSSALVH